MQKVRSDEMSNINKLLKWCRDSPGAIQKKANKQEFITQLTIARTDGQSSLPRDIQALISDFSQQRQ